MAERDIFYPHEALPKRKGKRPPERGPDVYIGGVTKIDKPPKNYPISPDIEDRRSMAVKGREKSSQQAGHKFMGPSKRRKKGAKR